MNFDRITINSSLGTIEEELVKYVSCTIISIPFGKKEVAYSSA